MKTLLLSFLALGLISVAATASLTAETPVEVPCELPPCQGQ